MNTWMNGRIAYMDTWSERTGTATAHCILVVRITTEFLYLNTVYHSSRQFCCSLESLQIGLVKIHFFRHNSECGL